MHRTTRDGIILFNFFLFLCVCFYYEIHTDDKSVRKYADMITGDPAYYYTQNVQPEEVIAFGYSRNGLDSLALVYFKIAYDKYCYTDPRVSYNYATELLRRGHYQIAIPILEWSARTFPEYPNSAKLLKQLKIS
jgi:predicted Zn-dependent protease